MTRFTVFPKDNPRQATRLRRYFFAVITSLIMLVFMGAVHIFGYMELRGLQWCAAGMVTGFVVFYVLLRSEFNLRFRDPNLSSPQMITAFLVTTLAAYFTQPEARGVFLPVLLLIVYFGVYSLLPSRMLILALTAASSYGIMILMLYLNRPGTLDLKLEFLHWWILTVVLLWFALMSGHLSRLRSGLEQRKESVEALLDRDELTGGGNRRYLTHMLEQETSRADRSSAKFCLAMLDLDFFKRVNDTYGHQAGDKVLITFAQVAQEGLRRNDYFGRYGGEEFMLIMSDTELAGAKVKAERLRANVGKTRFPEIDPKLVQTVSVGIAEFQRGESIEQIEQRADRALYKAKSNGRNRVEIDTEVR